MTMTPEEKAAKKAAKDLAKLQATATKLGVAFTPETTADELKALIASAEPAKPTVSTGLTEPVKGQASYYVWNEKGDHVKTFDEEAYKGEAFKFAKELADQHEGYSIS